MTGRRIFQIIVLSLFLVGLPAISWYYLKRGFEYRVAVLSDLGEYARLDTTATVPLLQANDTLDRPWLSRHLLVWAVVPEDAAVRDTMIYFLRELNDQFSERKEVAYLLFSSGQDSTSFAEKLEGDGVQSNPFIPLPTIPVVELAGARGLALPLGDSLALSSNPYLALTDSLVVRRYYSVRSDQDMQRLVEHIAALLPMEKEEAEVRRKTEK